MNDDVIREEPRADSDQTTAGAVDKTQIMLIVLVVLAVVASVVMLFSNSAAAMKIAVLAALWAAFIGLFLVSKYRRMATEERARSEEQLRAVTAELRAEQAELATREAIQASAQDTELLQEIREQLGELRQQLEDLSGRDLGYEPATLTAEASRIRELEAVTKQAEAKVVQPEADQTETVVPEPEPEVAAVAEPEDASSVAPAVASAVAPAVPPAVASSGPQQKETQAESSGARRFDTGSFAAVNLEAAAENPAPVVEEDTSRGRRRRDENADSISVAELLANLKKKK